MRFVCLHDHNIEEVPPVFPHHVRHPFVPAWRKENNGLQQFGFLLHFVMGWSELLQLQTSHSSNSHKAERTVGDEEELLPMTGQAVQNRLRLFGSQDKLVCKVRGNDSVVQNVSLHVLRRHEERLLPRSCMIHLYM